MYISEKDSNEADLPLENKYTKVTVGATLLTLLGLAFYAGRMESRVLTLEEKYKVFEAISEKVTISTVDMNYLKNTLQRIEQDLKEMRREKVNGTQRRNENY